MRSNVICQFSGFKIHPGHGKKFIRIDSRAFNLINSKTAALFLGKKNPRKIAWTQLYRKMHKKGNTEEVIKKKTRKTVKVQRAIFGAPLEVIRAKRNQKPEVRQASRDAALREIKERNKAKAAKKTAVPKVNAPAASQKAKAPKTKAPKVNKQLAGKSR